MRNKIISLLVIMALLMNGVLVVRAETCENHNWEETNDPKITDFQGKGDIGSHTKIIEYVEQCTLCKATKQVKISSDEAHDYYLYDNLGHQGRVHMYRIHCRDCKESYVITIICENLNGHSTPWSFSDKEVK